MRVVEWIELRTGAGAAFRAIFLEEIPASSSWPQVFGSVTLFLFLIQVFTGLLLALNYAASVGDAYDSVTYIIRDVSGGRVIRALHHWGASMMVIAAALHAAQVFLFAAYKKPREVTWMVGVVLLLFVFSFGLTGYLLPWDNRAYWGTVVTTQIMGQVPILGSYLQRLIGAEHGIGVVTFSRFYSLHVLILPLVTAVLIAAHLGLVRKHGVMPSAANSGRTETFYPAQVLRDTVAIFVTFVLLLCAALLFEVPLERLADPSDSSYVPRPEWYFLFLFQSLKLFTGPLESIASVGLPSIAIAALILIPFFDRGPAVAVRARKLAWGVLAGAVFAWGALTYAAVQGTPSGAKVDAAQVGQQRLLALSPDELAGFDYFRRGNCRTCHNLLEGDPKLGPNLAALQIHRSPEWIESHARRPSDEQNGAEKPSLSASQMNALVTFVSGLTPEKASDLESAPADFLAGADVFVTSLCSSCHKVNGVGGLSGPPLNGVATRRSRQWLVKHFQAPRAMSPGTIMPAYHFDPGDREKLISYLFQLQ